MTSLQGREREDNPSSRGYRRESPEWMSSCFNAWKMGKGSMVGGRLGLEEMREQRNNGNKDPLKEGHRAERPRHSPALYRPQGRRLLFSRSFHMTPGPDGLKTPSLGSPGRRERRPGQDQEKPSTFRPGCRRPRESTVHALCSAMQRRQGEVGSEGSSKTRLPVIT